MVVKFGPLVKIVRKKHGDAGKYQKKKHGDAGKHLKILFGLAHLQSVHRYTNYLNPQVTYEIILCYKD